MILHLIKNWVSSPHIYYLQRHNPFFFLFFFLLFFYFFYFFAFPPSSSLPLPLVLTLLWIAFYFNIFTPNKVKPNAYRCHSSNQHHKIAAWEWKVENGSNRSQRRHWMYLCCVCLSLHWCCMGLFIFFGNTQFNFCNMHIETERHQHVNGTTSTPSNGTIPTTAVTTLATADAKNSSLNPVSTPRSTK